MAKTKRTAQPHPRGATRGPVASMTERQRILAVLKYQPYDRLPVLHFGFWGETLAKWVKEGHLAEELARAWSDGNPADAEISRQLGFDANYYACLHLDSHLRPGFEWQEVARLPDGSRHVRNSDGVVLLQRPEAGSIPAEIQHTLVDRASWEEHYRWRYRWVPERVTEAWVRVNDHVERWDAGGLAFLQRDERTYYYGLHCGSLIGNLRNVVGVERLSYLPVDDEPLFDEMLATGAELCYRNVELALQSGARFDFAHFWEDICYKNGPLVSPRVLREKVGPH